MPTVTWSGHEFTVYQHDTDWPSVSGLYIFAGLGTNLLGTPLLQAFYVGQCQSFAKRIPTHEKWQEAQQLGATHVHARAEALGLTLTLLERALVEKYQPSLNVQLR